MDFDTPEDLIPGQAPAAPRSGATGRGLRGAFLAVLTGLIVLIVTAPAVAQRPDQAARYYEDALSRFEKNDVGGAIVQLKNALQQDPKLLAAYVLLGKAQLAQGDAASAEEAFSRALRLGVDRSEIAVPMAQALLSLGKYQALLERLPAEAAPLAQRPALLAARGEAFKATGDVASARRAYDDARALDPNYVTAILALADLAAGAGERGEAERLVREAMSLAPQNAGPWQYQGRLALGAGDVQSALAAFDKSLSLDPDFVDARIARAALLIDLNRLDGAGRDVQYLARQSPQEPRAIYLRAVLHARRGESRGARDALEELTRVIDPAPVEVLQKRAPELLMLGALGHHGLGQQEKARRYLEQYVAVRPRDVGARRLLASVLIDLRDERAAIVNLEAARRLAPDDAQVLALLGAAHMGRGQFNVASRYLEEALAASDGAPGVQASLGFNLIGQGRGDLAIQHLREAFRKDPGQGRTGVALAALLVRRGQMTEAVEVAKSVVKRDPENPQALNLLGVVSVAAGDTKAARAAYAKAVTLNAEFAPAQLNLAKLDVAEGNYASARAGLERLLKLDSKNTAAMYELALAEQAAGRTAEAIRWLEKVRALDRRQVAAASRLIDLYAATSAPDKALDVAKDVTAALPESLEALGALGRAYLAVGNQKEAQTVFARMARLAAFNPAVQTQIARYQLAANNPSGAAFSAEKALSGQPNYLPAEIVLSEIALRRGDADDAEKWARMILKQAPENEAGYRLLGDAAMLRKRYPEAIAQYRAALGKEPRTDAAMRLFIAHVESGNTAAGIKFLESWLRDHPRDPTAQRALAEGYLRAGNLAQAGTQYERILKEQGEDAVVLNNLANILRAQDKPQDKQKALEYAQRAYALAPNDAAVQDTLGWMLVEQGEIDRGIRHLRDARLRDPQNPEIRYHLAAALARAGRSEEARRELEPAMKEGLQYASREGATALWRTLSTR